jgi:hypothetical protein
LDKVIDSPDPLPIKLRRADDVLIPVLMSAASLPERLGGRVFVASDLTTQSRIERMELLNKVFHQIASEIRIPLALAKAFLEQAHALLGKAQTEKVNPVQELVDKSLRQIRKADVPLERVVRVAVQDKNEPLPKQTFDLRVAMQELLDELPVVDAEEIRVHHNEEPLFVLAPRHELMFCVRSILAYLVRRKAQVEKLEFGWKRRADTGLVLIWLPQLTAEEIATGDAGAATELELLLAEPVITNLMHHMGGRYRTDAARRRFRLHFSAGEPR